MIFNRISLRHGHPWRLARFQLMSRWQHGLLLLLCWMPAIADSTLPGEVILPGTSQFTLASTVTGQDYLIQVSVPDAPPPEQGYPVLYLLDGNARLPLLQAARDTLTRRGPEGEGSPLLIVAIGYPETERFNSARRQEDFTPNLPGVSPSDDAHRQHPSGGADRFLAFIEETLKPDINRRFAVNTQREAIFGHSFGGLFVLHALFTQPSSFERYIAISPSLWWYGEKPLDTLAQQAPLFPALANDSRLLIGVGEREQPASDAVMVTPREQRMQARAMVDNARDVAEWLETQQRYRSVDFRLFSGETHGSVMWPATRQALAFLAED